MNKVDYNIIGATGLLRNWFIDPNAVYDAAGNLRQIKEGDFSFTPAGTRLPILRFDSIPFSGQLSGSNMLFRFGINDKLLTDSPVISGLGSSTMAGDPGTYPNRFGDVLLEWLNSNATNPTFTNLAVGGYTMANFRTVANGGTAGKNCEAAAALNPSLVLIDEPTNGLGAYDVATQIAYMEELFEYFWDRGILCVFNGSRPRTPYTTVQKDRLVDFNLQVRQHPVLKYLTNVNFGLFVKPGTTADLRPDYDQGDGIHLNPAGTLVLRDSTVAWLQKVFAVVTAFNQYRIDVSVDAGSSWSTFDAITDMSLKSKTYPAATGLYRIAARLKDNTYTDASNSVSITYSPVSRRFLFDLGGDGQPDSSITDTGVMTPNNSIPSGSAATDPVTGLWWNNIVDCRPGTWFADPVDVEGNVMTGFSLYVGTKPGGTLTPGDYSMNFGGAAMAVGDYPLSATRDSCYFDPSAGTVAMVYTKPAGTEMTVKHWGSRAAAGARILQLVAVSTAATAEFDGSNNTNANQAGIISNLTNTTETINANVKAGSSFGYLGVLDITIT